MIRSNHIRSSARMQSCTVNIAGVCNHDPATVVFAHLPPPGESGLGQKGDDIMGAYACSACHDAIDGRSSSAMKRFDEEWLYYAFRGVARTLRILHSSGVIKIKGEK